MYNNSVTMILPIKDSDFKYIEKLIPLVKKYINPKEIFIISSIKVKEKCMKYNVGFIDENRLVKNLNFENLKKKLSNLNINTVATGWYFQQFLKLGFAQICKTKYYVCWDADMLPIRKIDLFNQDGKPFFTLKKEYLHRYFVTLKHLLNIDKQRKESFIAEHMVFNVELVKKLLKEIEESSKTEESFWEKILSATLPESIDDAYAFSEYETYGNWVEKNYPKEYAIRKLNMCRHAKYFFGENISNKEIQWAARCFDTLSFEHFDKRIVPSFLLKLSLNLLSCRIFLHILNFFINKSLKTKLEEFDWFWGNKTQFEKIFNEKKKIKVLFDTSQINNFNNKGTLRTGIFWVSFNILVAMSKRKDIELYLYSNDIKKTNNFLKYYSTQIPNLRLFSGDLNKVDVYLSSLNQIDRKVRETKIPCFTIIYDCIPMVLSEHFEVCKDCFPALLNSFTNNDYCFSISEYTKKDFLKFAPQLDAKKITTIPLSTNLPYKPNKNLTEKIRKKYNIPYDKKYLFSLCSLEPRKNLIRAVKTFIEFIKKNNIDDLVFVLGGSAYNNFIEKFKQEVPNLDKYKDKIIRAGYIDDEDMEVLYSNAEWFVYTSQYEGFGMPPLEAMACGTAVITSNNSSLPEVVGDAGIMIDWDSDEQHIAAYEKYYFDKKYRDEMAQKGLERSKLFSWEKAADIMVEQFRKCLPNPNRTSLFLMKRNCLIIKLFFIKLFVIKEFLGKVRVYLFGFLPLLKIRKEPNKIKISLFNFIPLFGRKQYANKLKYKILGIPVFKRYIKNVNKTKYYLLGIPVFRKEIRQKYRIKYE